MSTDADRSVTQFLKDFQGGDSLAFTPLWNRYFARLVAFARRRLQHQRRLAGADEEDVALSAFKSFHRRARRGDFPNLNDRQDLWVQLVTLANQKAVDLKRREGAIKRGGDRVLTEADLAGSIGGTKELGLAAVVSGEPDPAFSAMVTEECRRLLELLGDDTLKEIALLKMGLYANQEIADRFGRSLSWVNRKLDLIRSLWEESGAAPRATN